ARVELEARDVLAEDESVAAAGALSAGALAPGGERIEAAQALVREPGAEAEDAARQRGGGQGGHAARPDRAPAEREPERDAPNPEKGPEPPARGTREHG